MKYSLYSWNVNGIRAIEKKGFLDWLKKEDPYFLGVQETKARPEQLFPELKDPAGYFSYWNSAKKKGYSGVGSFCKEEGQIISYSIGKDEFDNEGRVIVSEFEHFIVLNVYFPNGRSRSERLNYKLEFYKTFLNFMGCLKKNRKKPLILCGDLNTAHKEMDLSRPKENESVSGFLPVERSWIDDLLLWGMIDSFRFFNNEPGHYTWWDYKTRARERNVGWRLDYFFIDKDLLTNLKKAFILKNVFGSDHCPVGIFLEF